MRGTPRAWSSSLAEMGLIPTYAGNTVVGIVQMERNGAHPHVCGEHGVVAESVGGGGGSSPRMRGTLEDSAEGVRTTGLIPTYAGNTSAEEIVSALSGAHPHVCGEHAIRASISSALRGSSPRMRGTPLTRLIVPILAGLIPTYAGNTPIPP